MSFAIQETHCPKVLRQGSALELELPLCANASVSLSCLATDPLSCLDPRLEREGGGEKERARLRDDKVCDKEESEGERNQGRRRTCTGVPRP